MIKIRSGRGFRIKIHKKEEFDLFINTYFPEDLPVIDKTDNIRKFRNSKAQITPTLPVFMVRGFDTIRINDHPVDLNKHTQRFRLFGCHIQKMEAERICIVENLDTFLVAEQLIGKDYVFLHKYGRIGKSSLHGLVIKEILVFVDYDFNGLDEYLRIKEVFDFAELYVPDNYDELFEQYSQDLKGNKAQMSRRLKENNDPVVRKIRDSVLRNNRFLEQQILIS